MKKITFIIFLLSISLGYSQQQQYNLGFEDGTPSGNLSNWATFEGPNPGAEIITNPVSNGVNLSTTTKVFKLNMVQTGACYSGVVNYHNTLGTWQFNSSVPSNQTLTMKVNKSIVGKVGIKFANATNGTVIEITDNQGLVSTVNEWVTLTWNISGINAGDNVNVDQIVVFIDWRCNEAPRTSDVQLLVDDISWGANKLTDAPIPNCTDGIQNGNETGVDCGGDCAACISNPTLSAASPTSPASEVLSVYSETYPPANTVSSFNFNAFQGSGTISEVDLEGNNNKSGKVANLSFYGAQWNPVNLSAYNFVHIDYYATTTTNFNFYLIDQTANIPGGNPSEPRYSFGGSNPNSPLVIGSWQSVYIPLSFFDNYNSGSFSYDLNDIFQWKFDGNGTFYFDNIYFSTNNLSTDNFNTNKITMYPNPASTSLTIENNEIIDTISIFNTLGQEVVKTSNAASSVTISVANLQTGVYMVKIISAGNTTTQRFIKK